ncbi:MAG: hypothetical protein II124_05415 [Clostridia bacterium]|nr:hypothetical protein [Clostridia bacterium]MBQ2517400.1 hypothetical protein [Clostridia bacterium]MBQ4340995.1 hypothetical protein [Clostridia bacterium]
MKKLIAIFLCIFMLAPCLSALAETDPYDVQQNVPDAVREYASSEGMIAEIRETFIETAGKGVLYETAEDAGSIRPIKVFSCLEYRWEGELPMADDLVPIESWLILFDSDSGKKGIGFVSPEKTGDMSTLSWSGISNASYLTDALDTMERLAAAAGVESRPVIVNCGLNTYFLYQSFGGDERVMPVPRNENEVDSSYSEAVSYTQLPTAEELREYFNSLPEYADAAAARFGDGSIPLKAKPLSEARPAAASSGKAMTSVSPVYVIAACAAGALVIAAILALALRKRRA